MASRRRSKKISSTVKESLVLRKDSDENLYLYLREIFEDERAVCVVFEYIEGTPLDQYAVRHRLTEDRIIALCVRLCDILVYLHEQTPPVIHRDIKPQNIIIRDDEAPVVIDFDAARLYKSDARLDTQFFGTREFA